MKEDLIGYLLDALEPDERERVEQYLATHPEAREHVEKLRATLDLLGPDSGHHDPPFGLAHRTCRLLGPSRCDTVEVVGGAAEGGWRMRDVLFAAGTCLAASLILIVAVDSSRRQVQRVKCEHNLQVLYRAMANYSDLHNGYFPFVSADGPAAVRVAGVYAPTLVDSGQITDTNVFYCPADQNAPLGLMPSKAQLVALSDSDEQLGTLCKTMGGSYGYAFGYVDADNQYRGRRDEHSPFRVLMADQPSRPAPLARSANSPNHGGHGQNVLYEDGHIQFITDPRRGDDDIYVNYLGNMAAGIGQDDSVVGYSERRAF